MANFWFAFDIGAYEDSTAHLTMLQDGAYNRLIRHYYKTGKPIPTDAGQIQRISGAHSGEEIEAVTYILTTFFRLMSDGYHNKRADNELRRARQIIKLRKELGRKGGLAKAKAIATAKAVANNLTNSYTVTVTDTTTKEEPKNKATSAFVLPDWIPQKDWDDFEKMRRTIRKPMTDRARSEIVTELFKLKTKGNDPVQVIAQSIRNSWQDVYELKGERNGQTERAEPKPHITAQHQRFANNIRVVMGSARAANAGVGCGGMGDQASSTSAGHEARPGAGGAQVVEGEIVGVQRP